MASSDPLAKFQWSARAPLINTSTHVLQIQLHHCLPPPIFSHFHSALSADRGQLRSSLCLSSASYLCLVYLYTMNYLLISNTKKGKAYYEVKTVLCIIPQISFKTEENIILSILLGTGIIAITRC